MRIKTSSRAFAVAGAFVAILFLSASIAWATGDWSASTSRQSSLVAWCSFGPGDAQGALVAALGTPKFEEPPGLGHLLGLNVTRQPLLNLEIATVPMHRSEGYATWDRQGYLLLDTYSKDGVVTRMYWWPVRVAAMRDLGCSGGRGTPFGPVKVPDVVGLVVPRAEAQLSQANLTASQDPLSSITAPTTVVTGQHPAAGMSVTAGTSVRIAFAPGGSAVIVRGVLRILGGPSSGAGVPGKVTLSLDGHPRVVLSAVTAPDGHFRIRLAPGKWLAYGSTPSIRPPGPNECRIKFVAVRVGDNPITVDCVVR